MHVVYCYSIAPREGLVFARRGACIQYVGGGGVMPNPLDRRYTVKCPVKSDRSYLLMRTVWSMHHLYRE